MIFTIELLNDVYRELDRRHKEELELADRFSEYRFFVCPLCQEVSNVGRGEMCDCYANAMKNRK